MALQTIVVEESGLRLTLQYDDKDMFRGEMLRQLFLDHYKLFAAQVLSGSAMCFDSVPRTGVRMFGTFTNIWLQKLIDLENQMLEIVKRLNAGESVEALKSEIAPTSGNQKPDSGPFSDFIDTMNLDDPMDPSPDE